MWSRVFSVCVAAFCALPAPAATLSLGEAGTLGIGTPLPRIGLECAGTLRGGPSSAQNCEDPAEVEAVEPEREPFDHDVLTQDADAPKPVED